MTEDLKDYIFTLVRGNALDKRQAEAAIIAQLHTDTPLRRRLMWPIIEAGVQALVRDAVHKLSNEAWIGAQPDRGTLRGMEIADRAKAEILRRNTPSPYDARLSNGKIIGDATVDDIEEQIAEWRRNIDGCGAGIAAVLPGRDRLRKAPEGTRWRDVVSEDETRAWRQAALKKIADGKAPPVEVWRL